MSESDAYVPPKVWTWNKPNGGTFANINRPISGATHEKALPRGKHPLQLHSLGTPNGQKVTILLEELLASGVKEAEYDAWHIDIGAGDQFGSGFVALNPNSKIPALIDYSGEQPINLFESGAILLHLAEKFGRFIPSDPVGRAQCLSWLFWQVGSTPYLGGGFGHFYRYAPTKIEYAIDRYAMEVKRQLHLLNQQLSGKAFLLGDDYSIADIAVFPWYGGLVLDWAYSASEFLSAHEYGDVIRWAKAIAERPAVKRGLRVNRTGDKPAGLVKERHSARDLDV
jgi:GSH-dependent disulfide-bond oxidoreductase